MIRGEPRAEMHRAELTKGGCEIGGQASVLARHISQRQLIFPDECLLYSMTSGSDTSV